MTKMHPTVPGLHEAIQELCAAITAETLAYRAVPYDNGAAEAAGDRVNRSIATLLAFDKAAVLADMDKTGDIAFTHAMALINQRWLIASASYQHESDRDECLLVDLVLATAGAPFKDVPMLWHVDAVDRVERPADAELQAGWDK